MALPLHGGDTSQHDEVVRHLADAPDGLSDGELTRALAATFTGIRPQTVNQLCRRMVAAGTLERVGSRPIRNRLVATPSTVDAPPSSDEASSGPPSTDGVESAAHIRNGDSTRRPVGEPDAVGELEVAEPDAVAEPLRFEALRAVANGQKPPARAWRTPAPERRDDEVPVALPAWDALQGWSRTANVTAALADWLRRQGATIRAAGGGSGSARDLLVRLGGDDVHVEVTGWPPEGARTHPTTLAADWFTAATRSAAMRRRAHPRARVVIVLPDTRRYRSLTEDRADALAGTEVWFVGPGGAVHPD